MSARIFPVERSCVYLDHIVNFLNAANSAIASDIQPESEAIRLKKPILDCSVVYLRKRRRFYESVAAIS